MRSLPETFEYAIEVCVAIVDNLWLQCMSLLGLLALHFTLNDIEVYVMAALVILVVLDAVFSVVRAKKVKEKISSTRMFDSLIKLTVYGTLILGASLTEIVLGFNAFLNEAVMGFIAVREMISIVESAASMGYQLPQRVLNILEQIESSETNQSNPSQKRNELIESNKNNYGKNK